MLDKWTMNWVKPPLAATARQITRIGITPDQLSFIGFLIGISAVPALWRQMYGTALALIIVNRIFDGLDGALARVTAPSDAGGFLDITLDFIFYSAVVWGFALADPSQNALPAATLIFSFIGTGSSFLAFAVMAAKLDIKSIDYPQKSLFYIGGLAEGTETIAVFVTFCLFHEYFPMIAYGFAGICWLTTATRVIGGFYTLKKA
jgi:phosphatidylglycerophosphate synthase